LLLLFIAYTMTALIGRELGGPAVGLLTLGILCLLWPLDDLAAQPISEPAFLAFAAAGVWASIRALERDSRMLAVTAGAAFAAATYMRPITLLFPIFLTAGMLVFRRRAWRMALTLAVIHTLLVLPWIARNHSVCGKIVPMVANWGPAFFLTSEESWQTYYFEGSGKSRESTEFLAITGNESEFNCGPAERIRQETLKRIAAAPGAYLWRGVRQTAYAWSYLPGFRSARNPRSPEFWFVRIPMLAFYLAFGYGAFRLFRRRPMAPLVIAAFVVFTAIIHLPVCIQARYLVPAYIVMLPLAIIGIHHAFRDFRGDGPSDPVGQLRR
ncbi:MAG: hypothetical protein AB1752_03935, partial [Candidatus Zixiibacteriota bacterium]